MRKFVILLGSAVAMSTMAFGENWTGKLLDATCYDRQHQGQSPTQSTQGQAGQAGQAGQSAQQGQQGQPGKTTAGQGQDASCVATAQTSAFAFETGGKVYKLDENGNTRAMAAMRNRAERSAPGQAGQANQSSAQRDITAKIDGTESAGTIRVTSIELQ